MNRLLIPAVAALLLTACATGRDRDARPDWIDGADADWPSSAYLTGIGSADELSAARDRARADLAKTFRVTVNETSTDTQQYSATDSDSGSSSEYSAEVRRDLSLHTEQVLEGVTVPESWQDPATKRHYALAVLNRAQAAARLRQDVSALDAAAETVMNRARVANDAFTRAELALAVLENQRERAALNGMLRAVSPTGNGVAPRWPLARLEADVATALSRITLRAEGEAPWAAMLAGQLADSGFTVSPSGDYVVRLDVDESASKRDGWHWVRGVAVLDITAPDGRALGQQRWEVKESATDATTAGMRMRESLAKRLGAEGRDAILKMVRN